MTELDPQIEEYLAEFKGLGLPTFHHLSVEGARELYNEVFKHEPGQFSVRQVQDYQIDSPGGSLPIRVYKPHGPKPMPVILFAHAGGWVLGDLDNHDNVCRLLAIESKCMVVSVDYRLAPENPFPAAIEDLYTALEWLNERADVLGGDPDRIAVGGDSSGGNLTAGVSLLARDRGFDAISHQLLIYPSLSNDFQKESFQKYDEDYFMTLPDVKWFWNHYLSREVDRRNPYAVPLEACDFSDLPPATVVTAEYDTLRDDGIDYVERLRNAAVPVKHLHYDSVIHGFIHLHNELDKGRECLSTLGDRLQSVLGE